MRLQLSVCHVAMNMERMVAATDRSRGGSRGGASTMYNRLVGAQELETKALLSLLLLDVSSSVRQHGAAPAAAAATTAASPGGRPAAAGGSSPHSGAAAGSGSVQQGGVQVTCSVSHIGLQDMCAPLEQRHVLSGAREPYEVSMLVSGSVRVCVQRQTCSVYMLCWAHKQPKA